MAPSFKYNLAPTFLSLLFLTLLLCTSAKAQYTRLSDFSDNGVLKGIKPTGALISDGTYFYGMTNFGGLYSAGTVFKIKKDGTEFSTLLDFSPLVHGKNPYGSLLYDGTFLYGMAYDGGTNGMGTVFKLKTDGTGFSKLLDFSGNATGKNPRGSLISVGKFLFGMTYSGGTSDLGTIFRIKKDGTGFSKLLNFSGTTNGSAPVGSLLTDGTFLYGTTSQGGMDNLGTVFKINLNGTGFSKLLDFNGTLKGSTPEGSLISDGTYLYGTTRFGGTSNVGTAFKLKKNGTAFAKMYDFSYNGGGYNPVGNLIFVGTALYGMTEFGGNENVGAIFKILPKSSTYTKILNFTAVSNLISPSFYNSLLSDGTNFYGLTFQGGTTNTGAIFKVNNDGTNLTKLYSFIDRPNGCYPESNLTKVDDFLYGMTPSGGTGIGGTLFKINRDGTGFSNLLEFSGAQNGYFPTGALYSDGTFLYGMTSQGGTNNMGVIFKIKTDGTGYSKLFDFSGAASGAYPIGALVSDGTFLYGTTDFGGANNLGVVFKIKTDGTEFSKLLDFDETTNGARPTSTFVFDGTFLYGITNQGGTNNMGAIFKIKTDGSGFSLLLEFDGITNGKNPTNELLYDGTFLFGMTMQGGTNNLGTLFKLNPDGTNYTKLLDFEGISNGSSPSGALAKKGNFLYGTTLAGGSNNAGVLFKIKPDGTEFTKLLDFSPSISGSSPNGTPCFDDRYLYGTTHFGGRPNIGTIYKFEHCTSTTHVQNLSGCPGFSVTVGTNTYTNSGLYTDILPSSNGCDSIVHTNLTIHATDASVSINGNTLSANTPSASYQWIDCLNANTTIAGETSQSYTPTTIGSYAVVVTQNTCQATSSCIQVTTTEIASEKSFNPKVFPNPMAHELTIEMKGNNQPIPFEISTPTGQVIVNGSLLEKTMVPTTNLLPGIYILKIDTSNYYKLFKE